MKEKLLIALGASAITGGVVFCLMAYQNKLLSDKNEYQSYICDAYIRIQELVSDPTTTLHDVYDAVGAENEFLNVVIPDIY